MTKMTENHKNILQIITDALNGKIQYYIVSDKLTLSKRIVIDYDVEQK